MAERSADWQFLITEDGEPWGLFVNGHVDPATLDERGARDALGEIESMLGDRAEAEAFVDSVMRGTFGPFVHLWICHGDPDEDAPEEDADTFWCGADHPRARPVTGLNLWSFG